MALMLPEKRVPMLMLPLSEDDAAARKKVTKNVGGVGQAPKKKAPRFCRPQSILEASHFANQFCGVGAPRGAYDPDGQVLLGPPEEACISRCGFGSTAKRWRCGRSAQGRGAGRGWQTVRLSSTFTFHIHLLMSFFLFTGLGSHLPLLLLTDLPMMDIHQMPLLYLLHRLAPDDEAIHQVSPPLYRCCPPKGKTITRRRRRSSHPPLPLPPGR